MTHFWNLGFIQTPPPPPPPLSTVQCSILPLGQWSLPPWTWRNSSLYPQDSATCSSDYPWDRQTMLSVRGVALYTKDSKWLEFLLHHSRIISTVYWPGLSALVCGVCATHWWWWCQTLPSMGTTCCTQTSAHLKSRMLPSLGTGGRGHRRLSDNRHIWRSLVG